MILFNNDEFCERIFFLNFVKVVLPLGVYNFTFNLLALSEAGAALSW